MSISFSRMDRYIGTSVALSIAVVFLGFLGIMSLFAVLEELREDDPAYSFIEMLNYVALTTPRRLYEVLPYVVFLGALIGLGSLASRSEIVIFRTAGVSPGRIFLAVAWPATAVFMVGLVVGEWVAPRGEERAESYKAMALEQSDVINISRGYWYREGSMIMRVAGLDEAGKLLGIQQYWYGDQQRLIRVVKASRAEYIDGRDPHWRLYDVVETELDDELATVRTAAEQRWNGSVDPRVLSIRVLVEPRKLSVDDLYYQINYMDREGLSAEVYRLAYWTKLFQPLSVIGLALLAVGFVLGPLREVGMGMRLSVGIFAGLGFKYLQDLFAPMSMVYDLPPVLAVLAPILVCWLIGAWGLSRVR
jgi:lipopolysaccharide export system permease protein